jgi:hypothetical protein
MGPAPDFDKSSFRNVKDSLGLDFPNLPYYIDGKFVLHNGRKVFTWTLMSIFEQFITRFSYYDLSIVVTKS